MIFPLIVFVVAKVVGQAAFARRIETTKAIHQVGDCFVVQVATHKDVRFYFSILSAHGSRGKMPCFQKADVPEL
jgi:hypothetical protein